MLGAPVRHGRVIDRAQAVDSDHVVLEPPVAGVVAVVILLAVGEEGYLPVLVKVRRGPRRRGGWYHRPIAR